MDRLDSAGAVLLRFFFLFLSFLIMISLLILPFSSCGGEEDVDMERESFAWMHFFRRLFNLASAIVIGSFQL